MYLTDYATFEDFSIDPAAVEGWEPQYNGTQLYTRLYLNTGAKVGVTQSVLEISQLMHNEYPAFFDRNPEYLGDEDLEPERDHWEEFWECEGRSMDAFFDTHFTCPNCDSFEEQGKPCPKCGHVDFHDKARQDDEARQAEIDAGLDYEDRINL